MISTAILQSGLIKFTLAFLFLIIKSPISLFNCSDVKLNFLFNLLADILKLPLVYNFREFSLILSISKSSLTAGLKELIPKTFFKHKHLLFAEIKILPEYLLILSNFILFLFKQCLILSI